MFSSSGSNSSFNSCSNSSSNSRSNRRSNSSSNSRSNRRSNSSSNSRSNPRSNSSSNPRSNTCSNNKTGGQWEGRIYFINDTKVPYEVYTGREMRRKVDDLSEQITNILYCSRPLIYYIPEIWVLYHAFIVFKTENWFWSIEKDGEGIWIQRSKELKEVEHKFRNSSRGTVTRRKKGKNTKCSLEDLIKWVEKDELSNTYYYSDTKTNCQGFADRAYDFIKDPKHLKKIDENKLLK